MVSFFYEISTMSSFYRSSNDTVDLSPSHNQILKEDSAYPEALIGRGTAYAFKRELHSAIADFTKVFTQNIGMVHIDMFISSIYKSFTCCIP